MRRLRTGIDLGGVVADLDAGWVDRSDRLSSAALHIGPIATWPTVRALEVTA